MIINSKHEKTLKILPDVIEFAENSLPISLINLSGNENQYAPSSLATSSIIRNILETPIELSKYTDPIIYKEKYAKVLGIKPDNIAFEHGADKLIEVSIQKFARDKNLKVMYAQNSYITYNEHACDQLTEVKTFYRDSKSLIVNLHDLYEKIVNNEAKDVGVIFIDNPCNPIGTFIDKDELIEFLYKYSKLSQPKPLIVIDEAYIDFVDKDKRVDTQNFAINMENIAVFRTFSKAYSLANLRLGYVISTPEVIKRFDSKDFVFGSGIVPLEAGLASLQDVEHIESVKDKVQYTASIFAEKIVNLGYKIIANSSTNFLTIKADTNNKKSTSTELVNYLLRAHNIKVRDLIDYADISNHHHINYLDNCVRITIGTQTQMMKVADALAEFQKI